MSKSYGKSTMTPPPTEQEHRRELAEGVELSTFCFGSMRLFEAGLGAGSLRDLLVDLCLAGVDTFHCSREYATFPFFARSMRDLAARFPRQPRFIVKLAEPDFGVSTFSARRVRQAVLEYRAALDVERLDVVQWMLRSDLSNQAQRASIAAHQADDIANCFNELRRDGLVGSVVVFPYHRHDVGSLATADWSDGCCAYVNANESEWLWALDSVATAGKRAVALRPFGVGRALTRMAPVSGRLTAADPHQSIPWPNAAAACVGFPLLHPAVVTTVGSISSPDHLRDLRPAMDTPPDRAAFQRIADWLWQDDT